MVPKSKNHIVARHDRKAHNFFRNLVRLNDK